MKNESVPIKKREILIDVGGGTGEYLSKKAKENPDKTFIILEPFRKPYTEKIPVFDLKNLHTIIWKSDANSRLPLLEGTVSEASANFLIGELQTKEGPSRTIEDEIRKYGRLIQDIKKVLKPGGKIRIVDLQVNINYIVEVLNGVGLKITSGPRPMTPEEKDMSAWSTAFYNLYESRGRKPNSLILPMVLEAEKE